jgi:hypothetical protein
METSMNRAISTSTYTRWPLPRLLILVLAGMYVGLMLDIRVEHVEAVHEHRVAWVPILFSAITSLVCLGSVIIWHKVTRRVLLVIFLASIAVGMTGVYLHTHGRPIRIFNTTKKSWTDPEMNLPDGPPLDAPMAFAGIGAIGFLASLERFNMPNR